MKTGASLKLIFFFKSPRPPLPKSLVWTENEAAIKIQAFYRGYLIRRDPEVQELRQWQRELREENRNIIERVDQFWDQATRNNSATRKSAKSHLTRSATKSTMRSTPTQKIESN